MAMIIKTKKIDATAIRIIVSCVVVTIKALESSLLSMINFIRFGFYGANIEKKPFPNALFRRNYIVIVNKNIGETNKKHDETQCFRLKNTIR